MLDKPAKKIGRPSDYSAAKADEICEAVAKGNSLNRICTTFPNMPSLPAVYRWMEEHETFRANYSRARDICADVRAEEIIDIADTCADPNKARVQIDARKWLASKMKPKSYGDRLDIGSDGSPVRLVCEWNGQGRASSGRDQVEDQVPSLPPPSKKDEV